MKGITHQNRACLTCKHAAFETPPDWKPQNSIDRYDRYDVRDLINETELHVPAYCTLQPEWRKVTTDHFCGQWKSGSAWIKTRTVSEFLNGTHEQNRVDHLETENTKLRKQLKAARQISSSRLARLRGKNPNGADDAGPDQA